MLMAISPLIAEEGEIAAGKSDVCGKKQPRDNKKEPMVIPEEQAIGRQKSVITPSVYPYVSTGTNTYVTTEFIWWKTVIGGTGYAYNGVDDGFHVPMGVDVETGTLKRPDFGFQPGCRIGIGTHFDHDGWNIEAEYTFLSGPTETNSIHSSPDKGSQTLISIATGDGVFAPLVVDQARCKWEQDFNVVDLALGRNFFISKYLTLKPNVGLKTAWIHEEVAFSFVPTPNTTDPRNGVFLFDSVNQLLEAFNRRHQNMWGLGLRGGIDTLWHVNKNWAFFGDIAFTTFWADFHIKSTHYVNESVEGTYKTLGVRYSIQTLIPVIETSLGLAYIHWFYDDAYRFQLQAGWEHQIWTDFNYLLQQGSGSLTTQGLTIKAGLTF